MTTPADQAASEARDARIRAERAGIVAGGISVEPAASRTAEQIAAEHELRELKIRDAREKAEEKAALEAESDKDREEREAVAALEAAIRDRLNGVDGETEEKVAEEPKPKPKGKKE